MPGHVSIHDAACVEANVLISDSSVGVKSRSELDMSLLNAYGIGGCIVRFPCMTICVKMGYT